MAGPGPEPRRTIAFARKSGSDSEVFEIAANGGPERKLASVVFSYTPVMSMSWSSNGKVLTYTDREGAIHFLDHENGEMSTLARPPECDQVFSPAFSPDGKEIAFLCVRNDTSHVFVTLPCNGADRGCVASWGQDHLAGNGADFLLVLSSRTLEEPMHEAKQMTMA